MSKNNKSHRKTRHKKLIKNFPCHNCITLPMCINKFWDIRTDQFHLHLGHTLKQMTDYCSLLKDYIESDIHKAPRRKHSKFVAHSKPQFYNQRQREILSIKFFFAECQKDRELILK